MINRREYTAEFKLETVKLVKKTVTAPFHSEKLLSSHASSQAITIHTIWVRSSLCSRQNRL